MSISESRIERALSAPANFHELLDRADQASLAERVEEALHGGAPELTSLSRQLGALVASHAMGRSDDGAAGPIKSSEAWGLAYQAGFLGFAQLLTAQAASKRAPDRVQDIARSAPLSPYIAWLSSGDRTNSQLVELTREKDETVSRKLKKLRQYGIAAFRRDGRVTTNFLTPLGRLLAEATSTAEISAATQKAQINESALIKKVLVAQMESTVRIAAHLQVLPVLGDDCDGGYFPRHAHGG